MIECVLRPQEEYHNVLPGYSITKKLGRYHGSNFNFKTFGTTRWVVGVYINIDHSKHLEEGLTEEDVMRGCIEYLNEPPPRKKYQKKSRSLYMVLWKKCLITIALKRMMKESISRHFLLQIKERINNSGVPVELVEYPEDVEDHERMKNDLDSY